MWYNKYSSKYYAAVPECLFQTFWRGCINLQTLTGGKKMTVKELMEILSQIPEDTEIMIRNSVNICGNIGDLENVEISSYGFFGSSIPCVIMNTAHTAKKLEMNEEGDYIHFTQN